MKKLSSLPNIGKTLAGKLEETGITNEAELNAAGCEQAFLRIRAKDSTACLNMLYAIEGAIKNIRWHSLPAQRKAELKRFFDMLGSVCL